MGRVKYVVSQNSKIKMQNYNSKLKSFDFLLACLPLPVRQAGERQVLLTFKF